jgi:hypothetical protein
MDMELFKEIASKCNGSVIDGCLKEIARLRQQIAAHAASQTDRDKAVAEACAKAANNACATNRVLIAIRSDWRKYWEGE